MPFPLDLYLFLTQWDIIIHTGHSKRLRGVITIYCFQRGIITTCKFLMGRIEKGRTLVSLCVEDLWVACASLV